MSITPSVPSVGGATAGGSSRRVRHQARDIVVLMAFSAASSTAVALGLLVLARLARVER